MFNGVKNVGYNLRFIYNDGYYITNMADTRYKMADIT